MNVSRTAGFTLTMLLLAAVSGRAQAPLPAGLVPPYEIMRSVRMAGFRPVAPPLREGSTYAVRATDFRGILMRVVVDANTGAIRAVNRIVRGPGNYGQLGMAEPPFGPADDMLPSYGRPPDMSGPAPPPETTASLPPPSMPAVHPPAHATVTILPPLPRPRPAELASRKPAEETKPDAAPSFPPSVPSIAKPDSKSDAKPEVKPAVTIAAPAPVPAPAAPTKSNKPPPGPPIND
jgi:hypothetical protein